VRTATNDHPLLLKLCLLC